MRRSGGRGLVLWFIITLAANVLLVDSALVTHYVLVFPAVVLMIAVGIVQLVSYLPTLYRYKVAFIYVAFSMVAQTVYYFGPHLNAYNQQLVQGRDAYDAIFRAADLQSGTAVYIVDPPSTVTEDYAQTLLAYLADDKTIHLIAAPNEYDYSHIQGASGYAFFVPSDDTTILPVLKRYFDFTAPAYTSYPLSPDKAYTLYVTDKP